MQQLRGFATALFVSWLPPHWPLRDCRGCLGEAAAAAVVEAVRPLRLLPLVLCLLSVLHSYNRCLDAT